MAKYVSIGFAGTKTMDPNKCLDVVETLKLNGFKQAQKNEDRFDVFYVTEKHNVWIKHCPECGSEGWNTSIVYQPIIRPGCKPAYNGCVFCWVCIDQKKKRGIKNIRDYFKRIDIENPKYVYSTLKEIESKFSQFKGPRLTKRSGGTSAEEFDVERLESFNAKKWPKWLDWKRDNGHIIPGKLLSKTGCYYIEQCRELNNKPAILFMFFYKNKILGASRRALYNSAYKDIPAVYPKYRMVATTQGKRALFPYNYLVNTFKNKPPTQLLVVESVTDCLKLLQLGFPAITIYSPNLFDHRKEAMLNELIVKYGIKETYLLLNNDSKKETNVGEEYSRKIFRDYMRNFPGTIGRLTLSRTGMYMEDNNPDKEYGFNDVSDMPDDVVKNVFGLDREFHTEEISYD